MTVTCEICGYESDKDVWERGDGICRCKLCANRAVFGKPYFTDGEIWNMPLDELNAHNEQWENHPINKKVTS